jgi:hypothetical protein
VVPAERRPQQRREEPQQRPVGVHAPVEADVGAGRDGRERPDAATAQVAVDLGRDHARRLEPDDARARPQVIRQPSLEVLARHRAERGRPLGVDVQVHRAPPLRIRARVCERREGRLWRGGDVPLVDEQVLARGRAQQAAGEGNLDAQRRARGMGLVGEVEHERGACQRPRPASGQEVASGRHLGQPAQELLGPPSRADLDPYAPRPFAARALAVRRAGRNLHRLARAQPVRTARDTELERSLHDLEPLDLTDVHVALSEEAPRASHHVGLEQLAVRLCGGPEDLDPRAQRRKVEHTSRLGHRSLPEELTWQMIMRRPGARGSTTSKELAAGSLGAGNQGGNGAHARRCSGR